MIPLPESNLEKAEMLKNMVTSCATGGDRSDSRDYARIRIAFLNDSLIAEKLPQFVKTCRNLPEFWDFIKPKFSTYHERRGYIREEFDPLILMLESVAKSPGDASISDLLEKVDSHHVQGAWRKALDRRSSDPEGAITAARTLIETVCKHVLDEKKVTYGDNPELPELYGLVAKELGVAPNQQTENIMKQIMGGCFSVVNGLGALRNKLGDSHGKGKSAAAAQDRHAHLAVNLAGTLAVYIVETWEAQRA